MDDESDPQAELEAELEALSAGYAAKMPEKLASIERAWEQLPGDRWDDEAFYVLHRRVHSLAGSGKTFGFSLLSEVAHRLEEHLRELAQRKSVPDAAERERIRALLVELRQAALRRNGSA